MKIAIIDDGVNAGFYPNTDRLLCDLRVTPEGEVLPRKSAPLRKSHGTICAAIIRKYAPNAQLASLQILSGAALRATPFELRAALEWCAKERYPLIHMSLGSRQTSDFPILAPAVHQLLGQGAVIVAASGPDGQFSIPAYLDGVIGVRADEHFEGEQYALNPPAVCGVPITASGRHEITDYTGFTGYTHCCSSYAAPLITARVYQLLQRPGDWDRERILAALQEGALPLASPLPEPVGTEECFRVGITGTGEGFRGFLDAALPFLWKNGYQCWGFSTERPPAGETCIPLTGSSPVRQVQALCRKMELDLALLYTVRPEVLEACDACVSLDTAGRMIVSDCSAPGREPLSCAQTEMNRLLEYLENCE